MLGVCCRAAAATGGARCCWAGDGQLLLPASKPARLTAPRLPSPPAALCLQAPDAALIPAVGGQSRVVNSVLSEMLEPLVATAMRPYEGEAVPESERIEQNAEELEARFRCLRGPC